MQSALNQVLLNVKGDGLLEPCEIEFLQQAHEPLGQHDGHQQYDGTEQKPKLACQYDIVNNVAGDQGLRETQERRGEYDKETHQAFLPVSGSIGSEVFQVFPDAGTAISSSSGYPVLGEFSGETLFEICEPAVQ